MWGKGDGGGGPEKPKTRYSHYEKTCVGSLVVPDVKPKPWERKIKGKTAKRKNQGEKKKKPVGCARGVRYKGQRRKENREKREGGKGRAWGLLMEEIVNPGGGGLIGGGCKVKKFPMWGWADWLRGEKKNLEGG